MSRLIALAASGMLVSFASVAPAMANGSERLGTVEQVAVMTPAPAPQPTSVILQTAQNTTGGYSALPFSSAGLNGSALTFGLFTLATAGALTAIVVSNSDSSSDTQ